MKKGFISIFVLLVLLCLTVSIAFISRQSNNNLEINESIYDKKRAIYKAESILNIFLKANKDDLSAFIKKDFANNPAKNMKNSVDINKKTFKISYAEDKDNYVKVFRMAEFYDIDGKSDSLRIYRIENTSVVASSMAEARAYVKAELNPLLKDANPILKDTNPISYDKNKDFINKLQVKDEKTFDEKTRVDINIHGAYINDGDLKLTKDLNFKGILIVKGKIDVNNKKLKVAGLLASNEIENGSIDYINDVKVIRNNLENVYTLQIISKQAY